ncbi:MAG TPA: di-trans,poly-cis-decaprenylcistransferase [Clostridiales bacterium]|jgi:undecaprenyl diphosphate synthase|nr:di-trans,poly-cis-decaprenylcistransferase [Clostridiales bacterium]HCG34869.1 di-trans,poly-cis-decaprenylcistransferase [Clostridiales bacterium]
MRIFSARKKESYDQNLPLPRHIGIIMDGNGRWATKRNLPRSVGHRRGSIVFETLIQYCIDIGIEVVTVYAFSTENWRRPKEEVDGIMQLLVENLRKWLDDDRENNMRMRFIGDLSLFSDETHTLIDEVIQKSARFQQQLNIAINYGSRAELVRAFNLLKDKEGPLAETDISNALYTYGQPDPDLIIRPGGEVRISNFMLWQSAYAEYFFTEKLWPDFTKHDIDEAIAYFQSKKRRFGGLDDNRSSVNL